MSNSNKHCLISIFCCSRIRLIGCDKIDHLKRTQYKHIHDKKLYGDDGGHILFICDVISVVSNVEMKNYEYAFDRCPLAVSKAKCYVKGTTTRYVLRTEYYVLRVVSKLVVGLRSFITERPKQIINFHFSIQRYMRQVESISRFHGAQKIVFFSHLQQIAACLIVNVSLPIQNTANSIL